MRGSNNAIRISQLCFPRVGFTESSLFPPSDKMVRPPLQLSKSTRTPVDCSPPTQTSQILSLTAAQWGSRDHPGAPPSWVLWGGGHGHVPQSDSALSSGTSTSTGRRLHNATPPTPSPLQMFHLRVSVLQECTGQAEKLGNSVPRAARALDGERSGQHPSLVAHPATLRCRALSRPSGPPRHRFPGPP